MSLVRSLAHNSEIGMATIQNRKQYTMKWIKASERLPENSCTVLFRKINYHNQIGQEFNKSLGFRLFGGYFFNDYSIIEWLDELAESDSEAELRERVRKLREEMLHAGWISVDDRPLFTKDDKGNRTCTEDGGKEFIAAVPYADSKRPNETNLWWIRHCVVEDGIGLCVVGDDDNEPAGWQIEDIVYWMPWPAPPARRQLLAETDNQVKK